MHKKHIKYIPAFFIVLMIIIGACKKDKKEDFDIDQNIEQDIVKPVVKEDQINEIISSFPSPVQMAALLNSIDIPFSKKYLTDPAITENYDTNNKKAFALGVLSADLGYLNIYQRTSLIVEYLSAIKRLADDLRISQFFDFQSLKRLATSNSNIDTLEFMTLQSFQGMDSYLRSSGQSSLSLLVITGVWLESLYLLTQVAKKESNETLKERIGEQKILFDLLYPIFKVYSDDPYFAKLAEYFGELQTVYENVEIIYTQGTTTKTVEDGHTLFEQNEKSEAKITDEQIQQITQITEKIRNKLLNQ